MKAAERLTKAAGILAERGKSRDLPGGERSMAKTCSIFAAITGHQISVADGWRFMIALKLARMSTGKYKEDDYDDLIGYSALLAEEKAGEVIVEQIRTVHDAIQANEVPTEGRMIEPLHSQYCQCPLCTELRK